MVEYATRTLNMTGVWWIPDSYENRMMGTLTRKPNRGCELKLVDDSFDFNWDMSAGIIVGLNSDQKPITLIDCKYAGHAGTTGSGNVHSFGHWIQSKCALVGYLFENDSDLEIIDLYLGYAGLDEYVMEKYHTYDMTKDIDGNYHIEEVTFDIPKYEIARIGVTGVELYVSFSLDKELRLRHKLHLSFSAGNSYRSEGDDLRLIDVILPEFLGTLMGHHSFITALTSRIGNAPVEIFDGYNRKMSWNGDPDFLGRLVWGSKDRLDLWPFILPAWAKNYEAVAKLCRAYIKILADGNDGFLEINNLVHIFFGLEAYYKAKCKRKRGSLAKALNYAICQIRSRFQNVEKYIAAVESIDMNSLSHARQVLVHANEGDPDYALVYHQLIFITRCVLLMEMEYPVSAVEKDTSHWELWHFLADRRKRKEANS